MEAQESLYVILGIEEDASPQQIKTAYKKAALRTHPDRALPERKAEAEVNFKRVAEAYEILSEPDTRRKYDIYGTPTSPPPSVRRRQPTAGPSSENFANTYFGTSPDSKPFSFQWESSHDSARRAQAQRGDGYRRPFGGIDPFQLFNQMFASEMHGAGLGGGSRGIFDEHPFFASHRRMEPQGFSTFPGFDDMHSGFSQPGNAAAPVQRGMNGDMGMGMGSPFGGFGSMMSTGGFGGGNGGFSSMMSSSSSSSMGAGGVSESRQTRSVNGRTETIVRRVDAAGNETVHTITHERQSVTVNGVEQPNHPLLQGTQQSGNRRIGAGFMSF